MKTIPLRHVMSSKILWKSFKLIMVHNEKKSGPSLGVVTERLLFPKIFRKISYFSGLPKIFFSSIVHKEIALKSKWKY